MPFDICVIIGTQNVVGQLGVLIPLVSAEGRATHRTTAVELIEETIRLLPRQCNAEQAVDRLLGDTNCTLAHPLAHGVLVVGTAKTVAEDKLLQEL